MNEDNETQNENIAALVETLEAKATLAQKMNDLPRAKLAHDLIQLLTLDEPTVKLHVDHREKISRPVIAGEPTKSTGPRIGVEFFGDDRRAFLKHLHRALLSEHVALHLTLDAREQLVVLRTVKGVDRDRWREFAESAFSGVTAAVDAVDGSPWIAFVDVEREPNADELADLETIAIEKCRAAGFPVEALRGSQAFPRGQREWCMGRFLRLAAWPALPARGPINVQPVRSPYA